jgi:hypothetical protein
MKFKIKKIIVLFQKLVLVFHQGIFGSTEYSKTLKMKNTNYEYLPNNIDAGKITDILEPNRGFSEYDSNSLLFSHCVCESVRDFSLAKAPIHDFNYFRKKNY